MINTPGKLDYGGRRLKKTELDKLTRKLRVENKPYQIKRGIWSYEDRCYHLVDSKGIVSVEPIGITDDGVYIVCPYCKRVHKHSYTNVNRYQGYRIPHCKEDPGKPYHVRHSSNPKLMYYNQWRAKTRVEGDIADIYERYLDEVQGLAYTLEEFTQKLDK